jgi:hypothetical protein
MRRYITNLTLESDYINMYIIGEPPATQPLKNLRTYLRDINREQVHTAVDEYFDEFEKMVKNE